MAEKIYDVVGIGNAIVDIIARCDEGFLTKHDLAKGFMRLIDAEEANRLYEAMGPAVERSGGSVANSIAGLASFGAKCGFIGRVAADQFGGIFRHDIRSLGVAYDTLPARDGAPTARCLILVTPDGERTMNTFLGASVDFTADDLDAEPARGREDRLSRRLSVRPRGGQGRLPRGGAARQGRRAPRSRSACPMPFASTATATTSRRSCAKAPISSSPTRRRSPRSTR